MGLVEKEVREAMEGMSSVSSREKMEWEVEVGSVVEEEEEDGGRSSTMLMFETRVREEEEGVGGAAMEDSRTKEDEARCEEGGTDPD